MSKIYIIGGANIDIFAKSKKDIVLRDSNPCSINFSYGGVGRNICENLTNFNLSPIFISAFGSDTFSYNMAKALENKGVDLSYSIFSKKYSGSIYLALIDKKDLFVGASDMDILNLITVDVLRKLSDVIKEDDYLIFDTNLKEELITFIVSNLKGKKIVDAISANKVVKLKNVLNSIDFLKVNKLEAEALLNKRYQKYELTDAVKRIQNLGVKEVLLSCESDIFYAKDSIYHYKHFAYRDKPVNVTGAGDALLAGCVYGMFKKLSHDYMIQFATACAILTVDDTNAVAKLNIDCINRFIENTKIELIKNNY